MKLTKDFRTIVLRSPGMFIGANWDNAGFHKLIYLVLSTALKPESANHCTDIKVTIGLKSIAIDGNGRGLSVAATGANSVPAIEHVLTRTIERHPDKAYYLKYGYLDYLGCVLNNLAEELVIETTRDGLRYRVLGSRGEIIEPLRETGEAQKSGTSLKFTWDSELLADISFDTDQLLANMPALKREYSAVTMMLADERIGLTVTTDPA